jgi:hypothetical protein
MSEIAFEKVIVSTTGAPGASVGSGTTIPIEGFLLDVEIEYEGTAPATTDVTIADAIFGTVLSVANSVTKLWYAPRKQTCDTAGAATGLYDLIPLKGPLTITVAECDEIDQAVTVYIRWIRP